MTSDHRCPRCGRELTAGSLEGLCPSCVAQELLLGEAEVSDQRSDVADHDATGKGEPVVSEGSGSVIGRYK
jgi:hypothetical protein